MRKQVDLLLQADSDAGEFLKPGPQANAASPMMEGPGDLVGGRYKLLEKLGEGGCGVVYLAEQEAPMKRRTALKIIKLGMDTRMVVARFEAERQALAMMDHPNIAKVFDAGATSTGRPYFVMELVQGTRITEYCEQHQLPTNERLRLFTQVCHAIQHAHQKGVIHRDIKPSNLLVTVENGVPAVKVIDFGIAKAIEGRLTEKTIFTAFEQFIGTPAYMSPEQAMMTGNNVDTRTDVYALGVLLYELLTGRTPFDGRELLRAGFDEMRRIIRDEEPPRPSTSLTRELTAAGPAAGRAIDTNAKEEVMAAAKRMQWIREIIPRLRGDLDWIVLKCLEKDPSRRYGTANGLALDIQRHLDDEVVLARPPSPFYLMRKVARRNRGVIFGAAAAIIALIVAVVALAVGVSRIRTERNQKDRALSERSAALEISRESQARAQEQLFVALRSQAQALRNSRQMGQRLETLKTLAEAARIRTDPSLRDSVTAAMALPDIERSGPWDAWPKGTNALAYHGEGELYARFDADGTISIRTAPGDVELKRLERETIGAEDVTLGFTFSRDGRFLAAVNRAGQLRILRWQDGSQLFMEPLEGVMTTAFSPDRRSVAVAQRGSVTCFDLSTGSEVRRWNVSSAVFTLDFSADSQRVAVGYADARPVSILETRGNQEIETTLPQQKCVRTFVAWHPAQNVLATGGSNSVVEIWNVDQRSRISVLEGHTEQISYLAFRDAGRLLTSMSWDGTLRLWQPSPGRMLMRVPFAGSACTSQEGKWSGIILRPDGQAQLWKVIPSDGYLAFFTQSPEATGASSEGSINADGTLIAVAGTDGVLIWDLMEGRHIGSLPLNHTTSVQFLQGGRALLASGPVDGLRILRFPSIPDQRSGVRVSGSEQIALPFAPGQMVSSGKETMFAVIGSEPGQASLVDIKANSVVSPMMNHASGCFVATDAKGEYLATSGWHSTLVRIWNARTGAMLKEVNVGNQTRVFMSPDSRELILSRANELTFYDLRTLEVSRRIPRGFGLYPGIVAFTNDGKLMAIEMAPGVIELKEVSSGRTIAALEHPLQDLSAWMSFTPDATQLVVLSRHSGAAHRWDLRAIRTRLKTMELDWDWPAFEDGREVK